MARARRQRPNDNKRKHRVRNTQAQIQLKDAFPKETAGGTSKDKQVAKSKSTLQLHHLPTDILNEILKHVLMHATPVPVSPFWTRHNAQCPPPLDYRILHSSRTLYERGLLYYYALNTWSIALDDFRDFPTTLESWPNGTGQPYAGMLVRRVHLRAGKYSNWEDSVKLLRGFTRLTKVCFDMRTGSTSNWAPDGGLRWDSWVEVPAPTTFLAALERIGVKLGLEGVWVGDVTKVRVQDKVQRILEPKVLCGVERFEQRAKLTEWEDDMDDVIGSYGPSDGATNGATNTTTS